MRLAQVFSRDEIRTLTARSDARGAWAIVSTWAVIAACFAALARFPHPLTFVLVVLVLGGRQLALAILMHEASHHTLFERRVLEYTVAAEATRRAPISWSRRLREGVRNFAPVVLTNAVLAGILFATGHLWVYSAWIVAWLTTFSVYVRIRSIAEHACTERTSEVLLNTRTTRAGLLARMTVAPFHVNFHIEHHLMAAVPCYRLPAMHRMLRERGLVAEPPGYRAVLALATR